MVTSEIGPLNPGHHTLTVVGNYCQPLPARSSDEMRGDRRQGGIEREYEKSRETLNYRLVEAAKNV